MSRLSHIFVNYCIVIQEFFELDILSGKSLKIDGKFLNMSELKNALGQWQEARLPLARIRNLINMSN